MRWSGTLTCRIAIRTTLLRYHAARLSRLPLALYLHIPFCAVRSAYCDFNTYAGLERLYEPYAAALIREIRARGG